MLMFSAACTDITDATQEKVIDYHVHVFSEKVVEAIEKQGFDFSSSDYQFGSDPASFDEIDTILSNNNVAKMLLISGGFNFRNIEDPEREKELVMQENNLLVNMVQADPDCLVGFYGLDPLKGYIFQEIDRCKNELRLHGLKLHLPISQVDLNRPDHLNKMKTLFEYLEKENIPVLIHNNSDGSGQLYARQFIQNFLDPLDSLTIIFAHAGGGSRYSEFTLEFLTEFEKYLQDHPNGHQVYFELSAFLASNRIEKDRKVKQLRGLILKIGEEQFLFGSDYPMRNSATYSNELFDKLKLPPEVSENILKRDLFPIFREKKHDSKNKALPPPSEAPASSN